MRRSRRSKQKAPSGHPQGAFGNDGMTSQSPSEPWYILGAGALGGLWATRLSRQQPVCLLARDPLSDARSLLLHDEQGSHTIVLPVEATDAAGPSICRLLVATKSYDALEALDSVAHRLSSDTAIYLMQNGLGSQEAVASKYGDYPIYAVTTTEGANRRGPHEIVHAGHGQTWIGPFNPHASLAQAQATAATFNEAGLNSQATEEIRHRLWLKLAINCAINPFTALLNCPNGELPRHEFFNCRLPAVCEEIAQAMTRAGYPTTAEILQVRVMEVITGTAANISSMLQDVRVGRRTEIDAINGYLVSFCKTQGLPCPVNEELVQQVRSLPTP